ncbi:MAG: hypothetical protein Q7U76_01010 [Nitrospirota bacterium]|nr:hypothetical protein [Nitrospirota bacterium]
MTKKKSESSARGKRAGASVKPMPDSQIDFSDIPESTEEELRGARRVGRPSNGTAEAKSFAQDVGRALRRAAKIARATARTHHTPIYVWENGKVVAKKP